MIYIANVLINNLIMQSEILKAKDELNYVIKKEKEKLSETDTMIIDLFQSVFSDGPNSNSVNFPKFKYSKEKIKFKYIAHFIKFFYELFRLSKEERNQLYNIDVTEIKVKSITKEIKTLENLPNFNIKHNIETYDDIYNILSIFINKPKFTLHEYIESLICNILYTFQKLEHLNLFIFIKIYEYYVKSPLKDKTNEIFEFIDCQIDLTNKQCIELIKNLFDKNENKRKGDLFILSLLIIRFNSLKDKISGYSISNINQIITNVNDKLVRNYINSSVYLETLYLMIEEEIEIFEINNQTGDDPNKNNNSNIIKDYIKVNYNKSTNNLEININKINISLDENKKAEQSAENICKENIGLENNNNNILLKNDLMKENNNNIQNEKVGDNKININELINKILNMKEININELNNDFKNIQFSIRYLLNKVDKIEEHNAKLQEDNAKLIEKINNIENDIKTLKYQNSEIKSIINDIQCRTQSKHFLNSFKSYLNDKDIENIKSNKKERGNIISERIGKVFGNNKDCGKKVKLLQNIIIEAAKLLDRGNTFAHSLFVGYYKDKIEYYKAKKNIRLLPDVKIFCFLASLNIKEELFDEAFSFLKVYFNSNLDAKNWRKGFIDEYFK